MKIKINTFLNSRKASNGIRLYLTCIALPLLICTAVSAQKKQKIKTVPVANGWAGNSINTTVFRKNSLVTFKDTQFISFYNGDRFVVLGKRKLGEERWQLKQTNFRGNTLDAHNVISIMVDGDGFLHLSWNHHNSALNYARSISPGSLEMTEKLAMTHKAEKSISYPEFYKMPDGNLLFFYRDGASGQGNLVINKYNTALKQWIQLQHNLIDGQQLRNAYWQACVDARGTIHISWVWRESPDVASNHDLAYACSKDGGITWERSTGEKYELPINAASAEYAVRVPQNSELINQTSMTTDDRGNPFIATYWRDSGSLIPQYRVIYKNGNKWQVTNLGFRKKAFSLSGAGTKAIPVSRPQIIAWQHGTKVSAALIFRDEEQGFNVSAAITTDLIKGKWTVISLGKTNLGYWEPTYDTELWKQQQVLHLFVEKVAQADAEGVSDLPPQMVEVLQWKPRFK